MVFIDYWNFQLRLNQLEARERGLPDYRFKIDWAILGSLLAQKACDAVKITDHVFEGCSVYTSFNPGTEEGKRFHQWGSRQASRSRSESGSPRTSRDVLVATLKSRHARRADSRSRPQSRKAWTR
jgi:hypothetical protein